MAASEFSDDTIIHLALAALIVPFLFVAPRYVDMMGVFYFALFTLFVPVLILAVILIRSILAIAKHKRWTTESKGVLAFYGVLVAMCFTLFYFGSALKVPVREMVFSERIWDPDEIATKSVTVYLLHECVFYLFPTCCYALWFWVYRKKNNELMRLSLNLFNVALMIVLIIYLRYSGISVLAG